MADEVEFRDDELPQDVWLEAVERAFARGEGVDGALAALRRAKDAAVAREAA